MRQKRRAFFYAALTLLLLGAFGFVYDFLDTGTTLLVLGGAVFWLAVAADVKDEDRSAEDRKLRAAFYRKTFGPAAPVAPAFPFLLLGTVWLCWKFLPNPRIAWGLLALSTAYTLIISRRMRRFLQQQRRVKPPPPLRTASASMRRRRK